MSTEGPSPPVTPPAPPKPPAPRGWPSWLTLDNRYLAPALITCILIAGHLSFGILEGYEKTVLAIVVAILVEMALGSLEVATKDVTSGHVQMSDSFLRHWR